MKGVMMATFFYINLRLGYFVIDSNNILFQHIFHIFIIYGWFNNMVLYGTN